MWPSCWRRSPSAPASCATLPQPELRTLQDSVDLMVTYDHRWHTAEIELTLAGNGQGGNSQDRLVGVTGFEPVTSSL
jgi:hypothetical protein